MRLPSSRSSRMLVCTGAMGLLLTIPPLALAQPVHELLPSTPQGNGLFGAAVDLDGNVAVVGMPAAGTPGPTVASGTVFVFRRNGAEWVEEQQIPSPIAQGAFGSAVAVSGDAMVIGAPGPTSSTTGRAYFYRYVNGEWVQEAAFVKSAGQSIVKYATTVDIDGELAVVSDWVVNDGKNYGAAYVYEFDGSAWTETTEISPDDGLSGGNFGFSIDLEGETLIVGMPEDRANASTTRVGSAYVYRKVGADWLLDQKLVAPIRRPMDLFGRSVALSGTTALIHSGLAAHTYRYDGTSWTYSETLGDPAVNPYGYQLAFSGQAAAVNDGAEVGVFAFDGSTWTDAGTLTAPDGPPTGTFGDALAFDEGRLMVGASGHTHDGLKSGAAYIFEAIASVASQEAPNAPLLRLDASPNPFNGRASIEVAVSHDALATLEVYDLLGRRIAQLHNGFLAAGLHFISWDAGSVSPGAYLIQVRSHDQRASQLVVKSK